MIVQGTQDQLDADVQVGSDFGRTPLSLLVQLGDQDSIQLLTVLPGCSWLNGDMSVLQPGPDHLL